MIKINHTSSLIFTLLALLATSVLLSTHASGQSPLEQALRTADVDSDGRIEPEEMTIPIKRYLKGKGYDLYDRHRIRDVVNAAENMSGGNKPADGNLKVPKFGVEENARLGVGNFSGTNEKVEYSEAVTKKSRELIQRYDRNGNGVLDEAEIMRVSWVKPHPSASDTNGDGRLTLVELQGRYHDREMAEKKSQLAAQASDKDRGDKDRGDKGRGGKGRGGRPGGFPNMGFGSNNGDSDASRSGSSYVAKSKLERSQEYVEKYFADRDQNKNGILDGAELAKVRSTSKYDTNGDGKIEQDEMLEVLAPSDARNEKLKNGSSAARRSSMKTNSRSGSRVSSAFKKVDVNSDQLIQMHEFSKKWTQKQLDEFLEKDENGDGVISPDEW